MPSIRGAGKVSPSQQPGDNRPPGIRTQTQEERKQTISHFNTEGDQYRVSAEALFSGNTDVTFDHEKMKEELSNILANLKGKEKLPKEVKLKTSDNSSTGDLFRTHVLPGGNKRFHKSLNRYSAIHNTMMDDKKTFAEEMDDLGYKISKTDASGEKHYNSVIFLKKD